MSHLADYTILVTGASSGIGQATAVRLAEEGARVVLVARNEERLKAVLSSLAGSGHTMHLCDVTDEEAILQMFDRIKSEVGSLNGLVHCAGEHELRPLQMLDSARLLTMLTSHVVSSIAISRALVTKRLVHKDGASIVWMSSAAALQGSAGTVGYAAAKGALISAARAMAVELARRRIRVNVLAPGVVKTKQSEAFLTSLGEEQTAAIEKEHLLGFGQPEDVAAAAAFLLSPDSRWITGTTLAVDGGLTAH